ncbi:MAG: hypothetical protein WBA97_39690 [Actinophytocola sp.]|uniref:hypothetical protein n=1 Tax=Actinophytocola sp. TaxID=1872138 RepID=UPI003C76A2CE
MSSDIDEQELRELFAGIDAPPGLDRWRERIADVHLEHHETEPAKDGDAVVTELRPRTRKKRSFAVAAAVVAVVGLGGAAVTSRLFSDVPPSDPTMIIDGPDRTSSPPSSNLDPGGGSAPTWGPMNGDPSGSNTGVPRGATLREHQGDLRITTPGQVITDLRVTGTVTVEAPNVTLRRVVAVAPYGTPALQQLAGNLTVVDSELSGGESLTQRANGLVVRRSRLESGVTITSGAKLSDSYLATSEVRVQAGTTGVLLRHNVMGRVTMSDLDGPIRGVTVETGVLTQLDAPTQPGSASIHVQDNRFRGSAPSTGWNTGAAGYRWAGNTFLDTGAPANP